MFSDNPHLTRRRTVQGIFALLIAALSYKLVQLFGTFLKVPIKKNSYGTIIETGSLTEIPLATSSPELVPEGRFWLVHDEEGLSALHSSCTHLDCLFSWDEERKRFICPCHGSEFGRNGALLKGPATRELDRFGLEIVDEEGKKVRDNFEINGAPVQVADLLPLPIDEEKPAEEHTQPPPKFYLRVDTSRKLETKPDFT